MYLGSFGPAIRWGMQPDTSSAAGMAAKRHHFVPQGFLRGFAIPDETSRSFVWVYDKRPGRKPLRKSVKSIAWRSAYYAQEAEDGSEDLDTLETQLAQAVDNLLPKIIQGIEPVEGRPVSLAEDQRGHIAFFMGLSLTRVPSFREGIEQFYSQIAQRVLEIEADNDPELAEVVAKYGVKAEAKQWVSLRPMIELAQKIAESTIQKAFQFFIAPPAVPLATSDNPVIFHGGGAGLTELGPGHPGAELVMNLRSDLALVCTPKRGHPDMQVFKMTPKEARKFNRGIVRAAGMRVFVSHRSDRFDKFVKKYADQEQRIVV